MTIAHFVEAGPLKRIYVDKDKMRTDEPAWIILWDGGRVEATTWSISDSTCGIQSSSPLHDEGPKLWVETFCAVDYSL